MKTAMQELIEIINKELGENTLSNDEGYTLKWVKYGAEQLLEKEKEQIMNAAHYGHTIKNEFYDSETYYYQTYNQNK